MDERFGVISESMFSNMRLVVLTYKGKDPRTLDEAFDITIAKWKTIAEHPEINCSGNVHTCGLCMMFHHYEYDSVWHKACEGCPIVAETGASGCIKFHEINDWQHLILRDVDKAQERARDAVKRLTEMREKYAIHSGE